MSMVEVVGSYVNADQGTYTMVAADDTAGTKTITTRLHRITNAIVQIVDSGDRVATSDADITWDGPDLIIADGGSYALTAGHKVRYLAFGEGGA